MDICNKNHQEMRSNQWKPLARKRISWESLWKRAKPLPLTWSPYLALLIIASLPLKPACNLLWYLYVIREDISVSHSIHTKGYGDLNLLDTNSFDARAHENIYKTLKPDEQVLDLFDRQVHLFFFSFSVLVQIVFCIYYHFTWNTNFSYILVVQLQFLILLFTVK